MTTECDLTFIIYFHPSRVNNLTQTIYFLERRNSKLRSSSEIIFICQEEIKQVSSSFKHMIINMKEGRYYKSKGYNIAARMASGNQLCFLDSDRILPDGYYELNSHRLQPNQIISTEILLPLDCDLTYNQIENYDFKNAKLERRYKANFMSGRTAGSGNLLIHKYDYFRIGGMDEKFIGYGFHDNDVVMSALKHGMTITYDPSIEMHLYHTQDKDKQIIDHERNAYYFYQKWNVFPNEYITPPWRVTINSRRLLKLS